MGKQEAANVVFMVNLKVYGYLALWTALWTYRFPVQWDETLKVENLSIEVKHKEKK